MDNGSKFSTKVYKCINNVIKVKNHDQKTELNKSNDIVLYYLIDQRRKTNYILCHSLSILS